MKVCVDATPLLLRSVGVKTYIYHWLEHLLQQASDEDTIFAFPWIRQLGSLNHDASQLGFFSTAVRIALLRGANRRLPLAWKLLRPEADLFHVSNQLREPPANLRLSATIHDFTSWLFPELHTQANVRSDKRLEAVLKRARALIAVSENTRHDAVRVLRLNPDKIEVIYPGVSESFFGAVANPSPRLPRPYILFVGTIEPRKNVDLLLDAYSQLAPPVRDEFDLVVAGPLGWKSEATWARLSAPTRGVRYLGYVPQSEMPALVAGAMLFVYPSLYEGFGFPVAEAMACGVPVITSGISSLPEVVGEAALLIDPHSVSDLRCALDRLLSTPSLRHKLRECGAARARRLFRWSACAQRSLEFFRKAVSD